MRRTPLALLLLLVACSASTGASPAALPADQVALTDGIRVTSSGLVVAVPDRPVRFCGKPIVSAIGYLPGQEPAPTYCDAGVDVVGVDLATLLRARTKDGATEGGATLTGTFTDGVLTVEQQEPRTDGKTPVSQHQPCPEPDGGSPDGNLTPEGAKAFHRYVGTHPEQVPWLQLMKPTETSQIMVLSVQDDEERSEAERLLRPTLGDALCLLDARWTRAELAAAEEDPDLQLTEGSPVYTAGTGSDSGLQPVRRLSTVWVTPELRAAADRHPAGLVVFEPDLGPV